MMRKLYVPIFISILFVCGEVFAADIMKVKGSSVLIELQGESAVPGDSFFALSADGKKRAIIQITKVKGEKALGSISKGKASAGMTLQRRGTGTKVARRKKKGSSSESTSKANWGAMVGYSMDTMKVQINFPTTNYTKATLAGSSFSAMGMFDYELFQQIWFRGLGGVEGFNVTGNTSCGSGNCNASIYYLSLDFLARYIFMTGDFRPWLGAGIALMFPASKKATALDSSSISNTSVGIVTGGFDYFINKDMFIPVSIEYGMLPPSDEVDASWIEFRIGLGVPF